MYTNVKTWNENELQLKALVDSEYTYTSIDKQLVKKNRFRQHHYPGYLILSI